MPIEFRCTGCQKLLRTPDDTAGKHARCPDCGAIVVIPAAGPAAPSHSAPLPPPLAGGGDWSGSGGMGVPPGGVNPYQSPSADLGPGGMPTINVRAATLRPTIIDIGDVFRTTWEIFKRRLGLAIGTIFVAWLLQIAVAYIPLIVLAVFASRLGDGVTALMDLASLVSAVVNLWIGLGATIIALKLARGQPTSLGELFSGGHVFLNALGASILFGLMVFAGLILCVVPGVIVALMFMPFYFLVIDCGMGPVECFGVAKRLSAGNKLAILAIHLLTTFAASAAVALTCGLGAIFVVPFVLLLYVVMYLRMSGQPTMLDAEGIGGGTTPFAPDPAMSGGSPFAEGSPPPPAGDAPLANG